MKKLTKPEGRVATAWLLTYLACGFGPSFLVPVFPGIFSFFGYRIVPPTDGGASSRRAALLVVAGTGIAAGSCSAVGKLSMVVLLGTVSVGLGLGILSKQHANRRANDQSTLWLVLLATLQLTADVLSRKEMLGFHTRAAVAVIYVLSVACGILWIRARQKLEAPARKRVRE